MQPQVRRDDEAPNPIGRASAECSLGLRRGAGPRGSIGREQGWAAFPHHGRLRGKNPLDRVAMDVREKIQPWPVPSEGLVSRIGRLV